MANQLKSNWFLACITACVFVSCSEGGHRISADADNVGLALPEGFGALKVADSVGAARHIAVNSKGDVFVKLQRAVDGKGIIVLTDTDGDGRADEQTGFGDYGGTGIFIKDNFLYASSNSEVFRYALDENQRVTNPEAPDTIITGLIDRRQHNSKSIALDGAGNIYVNIGAYSNVCQEKDRTPGSPGMQPCPILDSAGGIWRFKTDGIRQTYGDGQRYATGLRNVVGLDWNQEAGALFVMQHGRDNLHDFYPELYAEGVGIDLPSEAMYRLSEGADAGWPYIYYDHHQKKKIVNPEYGGDGKQEGGADALDPVVAFPGHIAPNALLFYTGDMFPARYKNGAFVAFHGSWNRAPDQQGFMVAFVPFENGQPSGDWEVFADGFAGIDTIAAPGDARHRPCGLAQGPDGSLYVSDDVGGTIYRIVYAGAK
ncbi:Glucose/arabinose dehydrogenase, beta-propeller fold [Parapedobacter luteus]|uniref:Glucose/arabinose dehydrogenase, beta-propeller fold n=1 Tax=Parapedobacter luteus TaxID=623280 RepID=A0A1T5F9D7_9SPHI|nr:PQQ-dependent sugar dehydrogenase [Parapedobacter luteus]SKB92744.1 Glucose/arabinose dehydrogenase, beta-propeller fold [Parapedobacter luteus]